MTYTPEFFWSQRKDKIYLTVNVPNMKKEGITVKLEDDGHIYLVGTGGPDEDQHEYVLDIQLLKNIKASESKYNVGARNVQMKIEKAESGPYWDTLLKTGKNLHCKVDWDTWRDEDEDDDVDFESKWDEGDMANLNFGEGNDAEESSDEDEMPDLEEEK